MLQRSRVVVRGRDWRTLVLTRLSTNGLGRVLDDVDHDMNITVGWVRDEDTSAELAYHVRFVALPAQVDVQQLLKAAWAFRNKGNYQWQRIATKNVVTLQCCSAES